MQIKNDYIKIKQGEKEIELHNLILNKYLDLYADSLFNLERKNLDSCLINCTVEETITTNMTEMHWDMFLSEQNAYNNNDFKDSNKIITKYQYEPNYEEQITPLIGRKILSIGFAQMTVEPEMADGSDAEFELYAVLDVSNYNLHIQKEQGFIVQRVDTVTSDLRFNSNTENFPIHLSPKGNSYFDEDMETGTHELAKLTSIGLGYNSKNIYTGTEKSISQLDFTTVNNEAHIQGMSIEDVDSEGLFPANTLFPANGWEEIIYQSQKAPEVQIDVEEENINIAFEIDGKSIQSETPSPSNPSEIHSVADDVNLLNLENIENHSVNRYYYENIGTDFQLKAGETYTLSFDAESDITPFNVGIGCGSSGNYQSDILVKDGFQNGRISITFTPQNSNFTYGNYLALRFVKYNSLTSYTYSARNIKLQKGTVATPYSPYNQGTVTIKQRGKNKFKISNFQKKGWNIAIDNPLKGFNSGQYTISCVNAYKENIGIAIAFSNQPFDGIIGNYFTGYNFGNGTKYNNTQTITQEHVNAEYMRLMPQDSGVTQEILENMQIQIEQRNTSNRLRTISNTTRLYYPNRTIT